MDILTQDGFRLREGDRAYNYYDMRAGYIGEVDSHTQPNTMTGQNSNTPIEQWNNHWFTFHEDDGGRTHLDGSRICTIAYARRRGWLPAAP